MFRLHFAAVTIAVLILAPLSMLGWVAVQGSGALWGHLARYVLPDAALQTFLLLGGVALVAGSIGTCCAWLVTMRDFPLRRVLDWALLLPMAVPTYIVAYAYLDVLHPVGPLQSAVRGLFGIADPRSSLLPDPRSLPGCALLMGLVLYPYVYLNLRAAFLAQSAEFLAVGRTLGGSEWQLFRHVTLPLARPALAVGLGLALLEALNDIGAAEYLGVQTLSVAIGTTWVTRSSAAGAAQIALALLLVVALLVWLEQRGRQRAGDLAAEEFGTAAQPRRLGPWGQGAAVIACSLPVLLGFGVPAGYLAHAAGQRVAEFGLPPELGRWLANSLTLAAIATVLAVTLGLVLAYAARRHVGQGQVLLRLASLGYAIPGTVLGFGLLLLLGRVDNLLDGTAHAMLGVGTGLLLTGSGAGLVLAYLGRFLAIPAGGLQAAYVHIPPSLDEAARLAGANGPQLMAHVHLPLLRPALGAAALLVFVDAMKELPATLLLRPLNVETLATFLHGEAARGTYEEGAVAALLIVAVGLLPMLLLGRLMSGVDLPAQGFRQAIPATAADIRPSSGRLCVAPGTGS